LAAIPGLRIVLERAALKAKDFEKNFPLDPMSLPHIYNRLAAIDDTINMMTLNIKQAHAFRILAEHSGMLSADQLLMFLGGSGGSRKSR
jgi:hypothetical protein